MLVVISILSLLIAILLPALRQARESSRQTACASNQKQLAIASAGFAAEHQDLLPHNDVTAWVSAANGSAPNYHDPNAAGFVNNFFWRTMLYLSSPEVWDCATAQPVNSVEWQPGYPGPPVAMMANIYSVGVKDDANVEFRPKRTSQLVSPSKASTYNDWGWKGHSVWTFRSFPGNFTPIPQPGRLHFGAGVNGGVNVVFADGHARFFGGDDFDRGPGYYADYPLDRWWKYGVFAGATPP